MEKLKIGDRFIKMFGLSVSAFEVYDTNNDGYYCKVGWKGCKGRVYYTHEDLEYSKSFKKI